MKELRQPEAFAGHESSNAIALADVGLAADVDLTADFRMRVHYHGNQ
jgi:hypothetical protein